MKKYEIIRCTECRKSLEWNNDNFHNNGTKKKDGTFSLRRICIPCYNKRNREQRKYYRSGNRRDKKIYLPEGIIANYPCRKCGSNAYPNRFFCGACHTKVTSETFGLSIDDARCHKSWAK